MMNTVLLNDELALQVPEGFQELTREEVEGMSTVGAPPQWCARDSERHMILAAAWKKSSFASLMLTTKDLAKNMEKALSGQMVPYGYQLQGSLTQDLGGIEARGILYAYEAQGIGMACEALTLKKGKQFYYLYCYMRQELLEESLQTLRQILASAAWN